MTLRMVYAIMFGSSMAINMTRAILSLFASELGADAFQIGTLTAAYAFFPFAIALYAGKAVDRLGNRFPVLAGMIGMSLSVIVPGLFPSLWALYLSQALIGTSHVFVVIALQNVIGQSVPPEKRDQAFGGFSTTVSVANFTGPIVGGYLAEHLSFALVYLASSVFCVMSVLVSFVLPVGRVSRTRQLFNLLSSAKLLKMKTLRSAMISSALVLYSRDIYVMYFPLYADKLGISVSAIGWIISIQGLAMIVVRLFLGRLIDFVGRDRLLISSVILAGVSFLLVPVTQSALLLGIWSATMGMGLGCGQPLSMATSYNVSPKNRTGEVLGLRLTINRLSQFVAPLFFGLLGSWIGIASVFVVSGSFLLGGSWLIRPGSVRTEPAEES